MTAGQSESLGEYLQELPSLPWVETLFRSSPLKKEKLRAVSSLLPENLRGLTLMDVGGDNGVMSYKLRELGGKWTSVDLIEEAVSSIREVVQERVCQLNGAHLPVESESFDVVAVVDMLEHLPQDKEFIEDLHRVVKPNGLLIVNVPNPKEGILRKFRYLIGQTDEKHGHLRPGYTPEELEQLLSPYFRIVQKKSYSRFFAQLVDTVVNGALELLKAGKKGKKGTIVTSETFGSSKKRSFLLTLAGPILSALIFLDEVFPFTHGHMLIVKAEKI